MADEHQQVPTREQIEHRAYELYVQRGGENGQDLEDWLAAEKELRNQHSSTGNLTDEKRNDQDASSKQKSKAFAAASNPKRA